MLLIDTSSLMHTGVSSNPSKFGQAGEFELRCIPYFLEKIASYYIEDQDMVAVFERVHKIPALAKEGGYKSGRSRNPLVEWEIRALRELLELIGFPILEIYQQESDYVINNYCRLNRHREDIIILSADMDLASNVCDNGMYSTRMSSFSTKSYNVDKYNFEVITGVPYNFMNLNKLLLGCKSDKIKPFANGQSIFDDYINSLYFSWSRKYGYKIGEHTTANLVDTLIDNFNNLDSFMEWYKTSSYSPNEADINELTQRWALVAGPAFDISRPKKVDWEKYNKLVASFNRNRQGSIKAIKPEVLDFDFYNQIIKILEEAQSTTNTLFEGSIFAEQGVEVVESDISNVIGILEGGDL